MTKINGLSSLREKLLKPLNLDLIGGYPFFQQERLIGIA